MWDVEHTDIDAWSVIFNHQQCHHKIPGILLIRCGICVWRKFMVKPKWPVECMCDVAHPLIWYRTDPTFGPGYCPPDEWLASRICLLWKLFSILFFLTPFAFVSVMEGYFSVCSFNALGFSSCSSQRSRKTPNTVAGLMTSHRRNMVQGLDTAFGSLVVGVKIRKLSNEKHQVYFYILLAALSMNHPLIFLFYFYFYFI